MRMTKVRIMHYIPKWFDGHLIDNGIDLHTRLCNLFLNPAHMKLSWLERWKIINTYKCSHVEAWWPDEDGCFENIVEFKTKMNPIEYSDGAFTATLDLSHSQPEFRGEMFTSTMRQSGDGEVTDGIVIRQASRVLTHLDRWYYFEYEIPVEALEYAKAWARKMAANNKGYDKKDIKKFFEINENKRTQDIDDGQLICSGAIWVFISKIFNWMWDNITKLGDSIAQIYETLLKAFMFLCGDREINLLPSPLLLALWQYMAGVKAYSLETGKELVC